MRLKSIEIKGFKSFADRAKFFFSEGLTGIVGPNGCGKSNVVEAIRWALSSDTARSLRAQKMEDIIFSGTEKKTAQNLVEVSISFEDFEGAKTLPFQEVTITKKLARGGDSQLYLNKSQIRFLDLKALFSSTGLLKSAFALFEQGSVDRLIRLSPFERRPFFEEAAGISLFLDKKKASLQKLASSEENIERVSDLKKELEKRLILLEKQKQKSEEYLLLKKDALDCEHNYLTALWVRAENSFLREKEALKGVERQLLLLQEEEQIILRKIPSEEAVLKILVDKLTTCLQEEARIFSEHKHRNKEKNRLEQELLSLSKKEEEKTHHLSKESKLLEEVNLQAESFESQVYLAKGIFNEFSELEEKKRTVFLQFSKELKDAVLEESQKKEHLAELRVQLKQIQWQMDKTNGLFQEKLQLYEEKKQEEALTASSLKKKRFALEACTRCLSHLQPFEEKALRLQKICIEFLQKVKEKRSALSSLLEGQKRENASLEGKQSVLLQFLNSFEGYQEGAKALLKAAKDSSHPLFGKVRTFAEEAVKIIAKTPYSLASLQLFDQSLIVKSKQDMQQVLSYAKGAHLQGFNLVCEEEFGSSLLNVFPSLNFFEKTLKTGNEAPLWLYIEELQAYLAPFKMAISPSVQESSHLMRQEEMRTCDKKLKALKLQLEELELQRASITFMEASFLKAQEKVVFFLSDVKQKKSSLVFEYNQAKTALHSFEKLLDRLKCGVEAIKEQIDKLSSENDQLKKTVQELSFTARQEEKKWQALAEKNENLEGKKRLLETDLKQTEKKLREHELHCIESKHRLHHVNQQKGQLEEGIRKARQHILQIQKEVGDKQGELAGFAKEEPFFDEQMEQIKTEVPFLKTEKERVESSLQNLRNNGQKIREKSKDLQRRLYALQSLCDKFSKEKEEAETSFLNRLGKSLPDDFTAPEGDVDLLERKWLEVKKEKERLEGTVNMLALQEFNEHSARVQELGEQLEDLLEAKKHLLFAICQLDEKSRVAFEQTFAEVRSCFKKNFSLLFEGGEADLHLVGEADLLQSGIEVVARPPGKAFRPLTMLSGGERCLTSIALLMAFFNSKAAPFCVLDEIDAPLDEANVSRFLNLIKAYSERCQFILVTHNKKTMEACTHLYGISMQERGISKAFSLRFEEGKGPSFELAESAL